jgi:uncharacterized membrane protein
MTEAGLMDEGTVAPPMNRMVVAVLSLIGIFVALYLLSHSLGLTGSLLCGVGDCAAVQASEYAKVWGIPVSAFGLAGYIALFVAAMVGLQPRFQHSALVSLALVVGSFVGFAYSAYLTYLEAFVIHAWCQWCVISAILMTIIFLASIPEARRLRGSQ